MVHKEGVELIELKNISKQYRRNDNSKGADLCIEDGDYIALMGPNSGEKTLMNIMGCLIAHKENIS